MRSIEEFKDDKSVEAVPSFCLNKKNMLSLKKFKK